MKTTTKSPQEMGVLARARKREPHAPLGGGEVQRCSHSGELGGVSWKIKPRVTI